MAEDGRPAPIPIDLERAPDGAYTFRLGVRAGFGGQETARIPIEWRVNPAPHPILKEIHSCEVGGRALEAANVYALRAKVAAQLEAMHERTPRGGTRWHPSSVKYLLDRAARLGLCTAPLDE